MGVQRFALPISLNRVMLKGIEIRGFQFISFVTNEPEEFERNETELTELLATGRAAPHIGSTFPLADVRAALQLVADGGAIGKVVFDVDPEISPEQDRKSTRLNSGH